jgi:hypothetical protein
MPLKPSSIFSKSWRIMAKISGIKALASAVTVLLCVPTAALAAERVVIETTAYEWAEEPEQAPASVVLASFGPFSVISADRAELNGIIETETPDQFRAMLRAYPAITRIDMIECPGTEDDNANFEIAHIIRKAGISTYVPNGGSVRSGGVELFLSGASRHAEPQAEFAVHSWQDEDGLEANDVAADDPINLRYINFYREMGMDDAKARAFYAMTNSTPNDSALYLTPKDIAVYAALN